MDQTAEQKLFGRGFRCLAGIDEAGRGPLAGPVVACAIIMDKSFQDILSSSTWLQQIKDSKKISPQKRKKVAQEIRDSHIKVGIGMSDHDTIDRMNILQASFLAMKKALSDTKETPHILLVDGKMRIPKCSYNQKSIIDGDTKVFSIAAASILAKVTRDEIMEQYHQHYPEYGFDKHKGYGTKQHIEGLKQYGPCPIHRRSFKPVSKELEIKS